MLIHTTKSSFLIEADVNTKGCLFIKSDLKEELQRLFGSFAIETSGNSEFPYQVKACKQEFANALILIVKEVDYSSFSQVESDLY